MPRLLLVLTGIVLVGIAGFALVWFGAGRELQAPTARLLVDLRDGKQGEVLAAAHPDLRAGWTAGQLAAWWARWAQRSGRFVEILGRRAYEEQPAGDAIRKSLALELGFMKGALEGRFEYLDDGTGPRLAHLHMHDPSQGRGAVTDRAVAEALGLALLQRFDARDWMGVHGMLSNELQRRMTPQWITRELGTTRERLGALRGELQSTWKADAADPARGVQICRGTFEDEVGKAGSGEARFTYRHEDGRWLLVDFGIAFDR